LIDVLIYSDAQLRECLINLLTYLLCIATWRPADVAPVTSLGCNYEVHNGSA